MNETALRKPSGSVVSKEHMRFEFDGGVAHRARIGVIVLATDNTIEHEFRQIIRQDGVAFYETRIFNDADISDDAGGDGTRMEPRPRCSSGHSARWSAMAAPPAAW
jgi:hypothetical protein